MAPARVSCAFVLPLLLALSQASRIREDFAQAAGHLQQDRLAAPDAAAAEGPAAESAAAAPDDSEASSGHWMFKGGRSHLFSWLRDLHSGRRKHAIAAKAKADVARALGSAYPRHAAQDRRKKTATTTTAAPETTTSTAAAAEEPAAPAPAEEAATTVAAAAAAEPAAAAAAAGTATATAAAENRTGAAAAAETTDASTAEERTDPPVAEDFPDSAPAAEEPTDTADAKEPTDTVTAEEPAAATAAETTDVATSEEPADAADTEEATDAAAAKEPTVAAAEEATDAAAAEEPAAAATEETATVGPSDRAKAFAGKWVLDGIGGDPYALMVELGVHWFTAKKNALAAHAAVASGQVKTEITVEDDGGKDKFTIASSVGSFGGSVATWTVGGGSFHNKASDGKEYDISPAWDGEEVKAEMVRDGKTMQVRRFIREDRRMEIESSYHGKSSSEIYKRL